MIHRNIAIDPEIRKERTIEEPKIEKVTKNRFYSYFIILYKGWRFEPIKQFP